MSKIYNLLLAIHIFTLVNVISADAVLDLIFLDDPTALCLDGSPGAYYISKEGDPTKFFIYF